MTMQHKRELRAQRSEKFRGKSPFRNSERIFLKLSYKEHNRDEAGNIPMLDQRAMICQGRINMQKLLCLLVPPSHAAIKKLHINK